MKDIEWMGRKTCLIIFQGRADRTKDMSDHLSGQRGLNAMKDMSRVLQTCVRTFQTQRHRKGSVARICGSRISSGKPSRFSLRKVLKSRQLRTQKYRHSLFHFHPFPQQKKKKKKKKKDRNTKRKRNHMLTGNEYGAGCQLLDNDNVFMCLCKRVRRRRKRRRMPCVQPSASSTGSLPTDRPEAVCRPPPCWPPSGQSN